MTVRILSRPQQSLGAIALIILLALTGCGRGATTPEAEIAPTSTLIPTRGAPTETPVPAEPTATSEPVATEAPDIEEASAEATDEATVEATEAMTDTEGVDASAEMTATEETAASEEVTATEEITATEEVTSTDAMTEAVSSSDSSSDVVTSTVAADSDARVFFLQPTANAIVPITFTVVMSYTGITLAPAADGVEGAGHFHILIDTDFIEAGQAVPKDEQHLHFGDGATTAELALAAGSHTLRLQYADNNHNALEGDQYRHEININVVDGAAAEAVRIASPTTGATVPPTFTVVMAASGINVEPAGVVNEGAGHFHLLIDEPFVAAGEVVAADETHLHFGKAQLTATLTLEPGEHLIRLQLANGAHQALAGDQYRAEVQVIVEEDAPAEQVMFIKPSDGATVTSPFLVGWAASGLIIETAGGVIRPEGGHLHLLVDEDFIPGGEPIPSDETHMHFGKGQTSTELTLEPGEHTLRLQMATGAHVAQDGAQYHDELTVTVR